jgi:hypothetical protein
MTKSAKITPQVNAVFLVKGEVESPVLSGSTNFPPIIHTYSLEHSIFPATGNPQNWGILGRDWGKIRGRNVFYSVRREAGYTSKTATSNPMSQTGCDHAFNGAYCFCSFHTDTKQRKSQCQTGKALAIQNFIAAVQRARVVFMNNRREVCFAGN